MIGFPLLGVESMLCTCIMTDCEYELFPIRVVLGFRAPENIYDDIVLDSSFCCFLKSLYNYRDIVHPLLFHLYRQLLGHKTYIVPSQTIPKEGQRQIPPRSTPDGPTNDRDPSMDHILP